MFIRVYDDFFTVFCLCHIKWVLLSRFLNLFILSIVVKSGISNPNDLTIFSISLLGFVRAQFPFLSEQALKLFNASFIFSAVIPCSQPSTFKVDLFSYFNILYWIILIIVSAIKQIRKCAFICSSVHTYIGLPSKSLFIILKESSILDKPWYLFIISLSSSSISEVTIE